MLESGPLSDPEFPEFASSVVLFLHNQSASPKEPQLPDEKHANLWSEKGLSGWPTLCFMDAEGNILARPPRSIAGFRETQPQAQKVVTLRAKGDKMTAAEQKELFLAELKLGLVKGPDIQPRADKLQLSADEQALVAGKLIDIEAAEILAKANQEGPEKTGAALAEMLVAGKTPSDDVNPRFWINVLAHASKAKDGKLAQRAFDVLEKRFPKEQRGLEAWKKQLAEAQGQAQ